MARRRLLWKLFPTYVAFIVVCAGATGLYAWQAFEEFHDRWTAQALQARAQVVRELLPGPLDAGQQAAVERLCRQLGAASGSRITIILASGKVFAESAHDPETMESHADRPEVRAALAGGIGRNERHSFTLGADMMYVAVPAYQGDRVAAVVRVALPMTEIQEAMRGIFIRIGLAAIGVAGVAAVLALWLVRRISRPLEEIRAGAERFARGEFGHRVYVPDTTEIAALAEALNQMAAQLDEKIRTITEASNRQEAMLSSMIEGVVAIDARRNVIRLNEAAAELLEADPAAAPGRGLSEVVRNVELEKLVGQVLAAGQPAGGEIVLGQPPEARTVEVHATVLRDAGDRSIGALLVLNDVTRLRRLERVRRDFVANVSHELKTPVTSIKGFVETLRDGAIDDPERAKHFLEIIGSQAERLHAIIEDLLSLSRIEQEAEKQEIPLANGPIRAVLQGAIESCQVAAQAKDIQIELVCPADLSARINGPLLEQAVANLIDNATKYSEPGKPIRVQAAGEGAGAAVSVQDWGCGISREHLPRLFERFYRVDKARSRKQGGTGLGLAIVKHIVSAHGGTVTVRSTPGEGSTFTIHLPAA